MADLEVRQEGGTLWLTMNRPQARNALSRELIGALTAQVRTAQADDTVRALVLCGAPPAFSAGLDLREVAASTPPQAEQDATNLLAMFEALDACPKPVIAAINGPAVAGGAGLASVCDLVLCARSAVIGYPEIKRGLIAAIVMTYLRRLVGERTAKYLLLTSRNVGADEALRMGLVHRIAPAARTEEVALELAGEVAKHPPEAVARLKAMLHRWDGIVGRSAEEGRGQVEWQRSGPGLPYRE